MLQNQEQKGGFPPYQAILEQTPNGVLMIDKEMIIRYVNPSFQKMFHCEGEKLIGKAAAQYLQCDCFERAIAAGGRLMTKENVPKFNVSFRAGIFPIEGENLFCGIFIDTSEEEKARRNYLEVKARTLEHAQKVINRQMQTAQEIARLLGETTAETKVLLNKLMSIFQEEKEK